MIVEASPVDAVTVAGRPDHGRIGRGGPSPSKAATAA